MQTRRIPNLGHVCLFLVLAFVAFAISELAGLAITGGLHSAHQARLATLDQRLQILVNIATYLVALALSALVFSTLWRRPFLTGIRWNLSAARPALAVIGLAVGFAAQGVTTFLPPQKDLPIEALFQNPALIWILVFFGTFLAPLFEEILFRGFLLPAIAIAIDYLRLPRSPDPLESLATLDAWRASETFSTPALVIASLLTSLCFGLIHAPQLGFSWIAVSLLAVVSLILCYVRLRTRSVAASTLLHSSYNLSVFITLFVSTGGFRHLERIH